MRNGAKPKNETARNEWPKGIRLYEVTQRPERPHAVQWRVDGKAKTKTFKTKEAQETFARSLLGRVKEIGVDAYRLDESEARTWRAFRADLGEGVSLAEVLRVWRKHGTAANAALVTDAVADYQKARKAEGLNKLTLSHLKVIFERFAEKFGKREVRSIERGDMAEWLDGLGLARGTVYHHFASMRAFFKWAKLGKLTGDNPCDGIKPPRRVDVDVETLTVAQGIALFAKAASENADRELYGRLALEAFAGLRFSSAARIAGADISQDAKGLTLPADKIKTRRRQYIDGLPDNLWAWIAWARPADWTMTERQYLEAKSKAFTRADIPHPRNCLRHSFATYHVAAHKDVSRTATLLCHSSPKTLWRHYKGRATEADGVSWFRILPPSVE